MSRPRAGIVGLDPTWSREVDTKEGRWHLLDNGVENPRLTLLCVHGNPSWSFLWRDLLAEAPDDVRVIAVDQLGMGYSERTPGIRRLATRIDDLTSLTGALELTGPVVTVAHDWGGPISLGWALRHQDQLAKVVLLNTSVHQPAGSPAPSIIRLIRRRSLLRRITVDTTAFVLGAVAMSRPRLSADVRNSLLAPYQTRGRREHIANFVEDIPLEPNHPSASTLDTIAAGLAELSEVPALLIWGARDPVFSDLYLHDLERRLPHAEVHRFPDAGHFVSEDADAVSVIYEWLQPWPDPTPRLDNKEPSLWSQIDQPSLADEPAITELSPTEATVSFGELSRRTDSVAVDLAGLGVGTGDRVAIMIPPGIDLSIALYGCWKLGAVVVLVDSGLGPKGMSRAIKSANPDYLISIEKGLAAARLLHWPGTPISVSPLSSGRQRALGVSHDLDSLASGPGSPLPPPPASDDLAAVVFTSGSTGPSKGVVYRHGQIQAQVEALVSTYSITEDDRLVAAFAPFALYGPAMGISSIVPEMDVTSPSTLTAAALGEATVSVAASLVFASPAAWENVVRTADQATPDQLASFESVRLVLSAGAPVSTALLESVAKLFPNAEVHTPYGMTEVLPVASISLSQIGSVGDGDGVCVGQSVPGVEIMIDPLGANGSPTGDLGSVPGIVGEIVVRAYHARDGYDRLWYTERLASQPPGWHRTGDVGHLDNDGNLWIGGRLSQVITTAGGAVTPVRPEHQLEKLSYVKRAAVVGVGPPGSQVAVAMIEPVVPIRRPRPADLTQQDDCRALVDADLAAVLLVPEVPVDRRHNSKVDRTRLAALATKWLSGDGSGGK